MGKVSKTATGVAGMVFLSLTAPSFAASLDRVDFSNRDGNTMLTLTGRSGSTAAEIYNTLQRAGVPPNHLIPQEVISGRWIEASVYYLNGLMYQAKLTIGPGSFYGLLPDRCAPASSCSHSSPRLVLGGEVANELFDDLENAGAQEIRSTTGNLLHEDSISCSEVEIQGSRYSCTISLPREP